MRLRTGMLRASGDLNKVSVTNWAETVETDIEQFRYPEDADEVIELVKSNDKIRCSGALHSCAPLIVSDGIILSLTKLDEIISPSILKHESFACSLASVSMICVRRWHRMGWRWVHWVRLTGRQSRVLS